MSARKRFYETEDGEIEETMAKKTEYVEPMETEVESIVESTPPAPEKAEGEVDPNIFAPSDPRSPYYGAFLEGGFKAAAEASQRK